MIQVKPLGDQAIILQVGETISPEVHLKVQRWCSLLEKGNIKGIVEWVPTYINVTIYYAPYIASYEEIVHQLKGLESRLQTSVTLKKEIVHIPVCYGGKFGPDLEEVGQYNGLTAEEVIYIHSSVDYLVYMIGFAPGFPYLGGMSDKIVTPRLKTPRSVIPSGSVGIADKQTGIYSLETPGGWRIIGKTPYQLFDEKKNPPALLRSGQYVRFRPITVEEFDELDRR